MKKNILLTVFVAFLLNINGAVFAAIPMPTSEASVSIVHTAKVKEPKKKKKRSANRNGVLSMSFGIASFLFFPLLGIPAVIFGIIALTNKEPKNGFSISGLILGGITTLMSIALAGLLIAGII